MNELCGVISSHRLYRVFAEWLRVNLENSLFSHGLSFTKDGLLLHFLSGKRQICFEVKFVDGELMLLPSNWTDIKSRLKSNAVVQFKELEGKQVEDILYGLFDRVFAIKFNDGSRLLFKSFGRFGNVIHYHELSDTPEAVFRLNFKKDWELNWSSIASLWQSAKSEDLTLPFFEDLESWSRQIKGLNIQEIIEKRPDFFSLEKHKQQDLIKQLSNFDSYIPILEAQNETATLKWRENINNEDVFQKTEECLRMYLRWYFFEREKNLLQIESVRQLKSIRNKLKTYTKRRNEIEEQRSYKELGDLILGHAHSIRKGTSEALITDFFTGHRIRVKLNPELTAAENAEKCYKKAKNQGLELANIQEQIETLESQLKLWEEVEVALAKAESPKDLRQFRELLPQLKSTSSKSSDSHKPYKRINFEGYEIWLGRNAKSNDALLRESNKNDIWMHAADVTGSHVIIRNSGKTVPKNILEEVAAFCAFNSKGKSQTLQTVMYTERKLVSKAKNGAPGEVKVGKFQTIDVEPKNLSNIS